MAVKKSELYSMLWEACNKLRGGVEPSRYKDYVLVLLFFKYVSDRYKGQPFAQFTISKGASLLQNLVVRAINMALGKKDTMNETLQRNVETVLTGTQGVPLTEIDARLEELQKELLKVANAKGNYDSIVDEIYSLREAKQNAQMDNAEREGMKQRISEMQQFLAEQTQNITEYDEQLVRRLIEKITVYGERVTVEFKSGTSVDVRR